MPTACPLLLLLLLLHLVPCQVKLCSSAPHTPPPPPCPPLLAQSHKSSKGSNCNRPTTTTRTRTTRDSWSGLGKLLLLLLLVLLYNTSPNFELNANILVMYSSNKYLQVALFIWVIKIYLHSMMPYGNK